MWEEQQQQDQLQLQRLQAQQLVQQEELRAQLAKQQDIKILHLQGETGELAAALPVVAEPAAPAAQSAMHQAGQARQFQQVKQLLAPAPRCAEVGAPGAGKGLLPTKPPAGPELLSVALAGAADLGSLALGGHGSRQSSAAAFSIMAYHGGALDDSQSGTFAAVLAGLIRQGTAGSALGDSEGPGQSLPNVSLGTGASVPGLTAGSSIPAQYSSQRSLSAAQQPMGNRYQAAAEGLASEGGSVVQVLLGMGPAQHHDHVVQCMPGSQRAPAMLSMPGPYADSCGDAALTAWQTASCVSADGAGSRVEHLCFASDGQRATRPSADTGANSITQANGSGGAGECVQAHQQVHATHFSTFLNFLYSSGSGSGGTAT